ncbi:hypothetical protein [Phormidesmis sp. 146-33]
MNLSDRPSLLPGVAGDVSIQSLSQVWAKRYVEKLAAQDQYLERVSERGVRRDLARNLLETLRPTIAQAWIKTEALLAREVVRHEIDFHLINPWDIAKDAYDIYEKALSAYANNLSPARLSVLVSADLGKIRHKYTHVDPRVIGFVSMQFHYSGQMLLSLLPKSQQIVLTDYFKVIDDHLYMPLQRAYGMAAQHDYDSPALQLVQTLLPVSSAISRKIVSRVLKLYPRYQCHTGALNELSVQISSIRDVEMFQVYLWVCVLENNISAIQQELFPLCVMLYPRLKVRWELVRQLIHLLGAEVRSYLEPSQAKYYAPYYQALWSMFSPEIFPDSDDG